MLISVTPIIHLTPTEAIIMTNAKLASVSDEPLLIMLMSSLNKGYSSSKAQKSQFRSVHGRRGGIIGTAG